MNKYVQEFLKEESVCKFIVDKPHSTKAKIKYDNINTECEIWFLKDNKKTPVDKVLNSNNKDIIAIIENGNDFYKKCGNDAVESLYEKLELFCKNVKIK